MKNQNMIGQIYQNRGGKLGDPFVEQYFVRIVDMKPDKLFGKKMWVKYAFLHGKPGEWTQGTMSSSIELASFLDMYAFVCTDLDYQSSLSIDAQGDQIKNAISQLEVKDEND